MSNSSNKTHNPERPFGVSYINLKGPTVTTEVTVLISGNKACEVSILDGGPGTPLPRDSTVVKPGGFVKKTVHGEQTVLVKETGEFL